MSAPTSAGSESGMGSSTTRRSDGSAPEEVWRRRTGGIIEQFPEASRMAQFPAGANRAAPETRPSASMAGDIDRPEGPRASDPDEGEVRIGERTTLAFPGNNEGGP